MQSLLDQVNILIKMNVGDPYRLQHIKLMLKQKRTVYGSDRAYLDHLIHDYIEEVKTQKNLAKIRGEDPFEDQLDEKNSDEDEDEDELVELDHIYCWKCGKSIPVNSKFCLVCGADIKKPDVQENIVDKVPDKTIIENLSEESPKKIKKKRSWKKKIGIGIGTIIVLFFGLVILSSIALETSETELKNLDLSPQEIQRQAITGITFDQLMRDNEEYVDKILLLEGEITQAQNVYGDKYVLRISITKENLAFGTIYYSDPVWVNYAGERILQGDKVQFYGQVQGIKEYTAVLGNSIEIPELNSLILEVGTITIEELDETLSPINSKCGSGTVFDDATNTCILEGTQTNSKCGSGTVFDDVTNTCLLK